MSSVPDTPVIDLKRLAELRDEIGIDDLAEVAAVFLDETDAVIARIKRASAGASLAEDLHFLKGSALNLGLTALANLCQSEEKARQIGGSKPLIDHFHLDMVYSASKSAFLAALAEGRA